MVFEGWVVDHLSSWLGHFLDLQRDQLRISLWRAWQTGVTLENIPLRLDAFEYLELPVRPVAGHIGRLQLQVPWQALRSPLVLEIADARLELALREDSDLREGPALARAQARRQARLAGAEAAAGAGAAGGAEGAAGLDSHGGSGWAWGLAGSLITFLVNRLQIRLSNVRLVLRDPGTGVAVELVVDSVQTCSPSAALRVLGSSLEEALESDLAPSPARVRKDIAVCGVRLGVSSGTAPAEALLPPCDAVLHVSTLSVLGVEAPRADAVLTVPALRLGAGARELADLAALADAARRVAALNRVAEFCPDAWRLERRLDAPRMWRYAANAALRTQARWDAGVGAWAPAATRADRRRRYVNAVAEQLAGERPPDGSPPEPVLDELEGQLSVPEITLCRAVAQRVAAARAAKLGRQAKKRKVASAEPASAAERKTSGGARAQVPTPPPPALETAAALALVAENAMPADEDRETPGAVDSPNELMDGLEGSHARLSTDSEGATTDSSAASRKAATLEDAGAPADPLNDSDVSQDTAAALTAASEAARARKGMVSRTLSTLSGFFHYLPRAPGRAEPDRGALVAEEEEAAAARLLESLQIPTGGAAAAAPSQLRVSLRLRLPTIALVARDALGSVVAALELKGARAAVVFDGSALACSLRLRRLVLSDDGAAGHRPGAGHGAWGSPPLLECGSAAPDAAFSPTPGVEGEIVDPALARLGRADGLAEDGARDDQPSAALTLRYIRGEGEAPSAEAELAGVSATLRPAALASVLRVLPPPGEFATALSEAARGVEAAEGDPDKGSGPSSSIVPDSRAAIAWTVRAAGVEAALPLPDGRRIVALSVGRLSAHSGELGLCRWGLRHVTVSVVTLSRPEYGALSGGGRSEYGPAAAGPVPYHLRSAPARPAGRGPASHAGSDPEPSVLILRPLVLHGHIRLPVANVQGLAVSVEARAVSLSLGTALVEEVAAALRPLADALAPAPKPASARQPSSAPMMYPPSPAAVPACLFPTRIVLTLHQQVSLTVVFDAGDHAPGSSALLTLRCEGGCVGATIGDAPAPSVPLQLDGWLRGLELSDGAAPAAWAGRGAQGPAPLPFFPVLDLGGAVRLCGRLALAGLGFRHRQLRLGRADVRASTAVSLEDAAATGYQDEPGNFIARLHRERPNRGRICVEEGAAHTHVGVELQNVLVGHAALARILVLVLALVDGGPAPEAPAPPGAAPATESFDLVLRDCVAEFRYQPAGRAARRLSADAADFLLAHGTLAVLEAPLCTLRFPLEEPGERAALRDVRLSVATLGVSGHALLPIVCVPNARLVVEAATEHGEGEGSAHDRTAAQLMDKHFDVEVGPIESVLHPSQLSMLSTGAQILDDELGMLTRAPGEGAGAPESHAALSRAATSEPPPAPSAAQSSADGPANGDPPAASLRSESLALADEERAAARAAGRARRRDRPSSPGAQAADAARLVALAASVHASVRVSALAVRLLGPHVASAGLDLRCEDLRAALGAQEAPRTCALGWRAVTVDLLRPSPEPFTPFSLVTRRLSAEAAAAAEASGGLHAQHSLATQVNGLSPRARGTSTSDFVDEEGEVFYEALSRSMRRPSRSNATSGAASRYYSLHGSESEAFEEEFEENKASLSGGFGDDPGGDSPQAGREESALVLPLANAQRIELVRLSSRPGRALELLATLEAPPPGLASDEVTADAAIEESLPADDSEPVCISLALPPVIASCVVELATWEEAAACVGACVVAVPGTVATLQSVLAASAEDGGAAPAARIPGADATEGDSASLLSALALVRLRATCERAELRVVAPLASARGEDLAVPGPGGPEASQLPSPHARVPLWQAQAAESGPEGRIAGGSLLCTLQTSWQAGWRPHAAGGAAEASFHTPALGLRVALLGANAAALSAAIASGAAIEGLAEHETALGLSGFELLLQTPLPVGGSTRTAPSTSVYGAEDVSLESEDGTSVGSGRSDGHADSQGAMSSPRSGPHPLDDPEPVRSLSTLSQASSVARPATIVSGSGSRAISGSAHGSDQELPRPEGSGTAAQFEGPVLSLAVDRISVWLTQEAVAVGWALAQTVDILRERIAEQWAELRTGVVGVDPSPPISQPPVAAAKPGSVPGELVVRARLGLLACRLALLCLPSEAGTAQISAGGASMPVAQAALLGAALDARLGLGLADAWVQLRTGLRADCWSPQLAGWEPLVEPWTCQAVAASGEHSAAGGSAQALPPRLALSSTSPLELTATPGAAAALGALSRCYGLALQAKPADVVDAALAARQAAGGLCVSGERRLCNASGSRVSVWLGCEGHVDPAAAGLAPTLTIGPGETADLPVWPESKERLLRRARGLAGCPDLETGGVLHAEDEECKEGRSSVADQAPRADLRSEPLRSEPLRSEPLRSSLFFQGAGASGWVQLDVLGTRRFVAGAAHASSLAEDGAGAHERRASHLPPRPVASASFPSLAAAGALGGGAAAPPEAAGLLASVRPARSAWGGTVLTLHSAVRVRNATGARLDVRLHTPLGLVAESLGARPALGTLGPGQSMWLPAEHALHGAICVRPAERRWRGPAPATSPGAAATAGQRPASRGPNKAPSVAESVIATFAADGEAEDGAAAAAPARSPLRTGSGVLFAPDVSARPLARHASLQVVAAPGSRTHSPPRAPSDAHYAAAQSSPGDEDAPSPFAGRPVPRPAPRRDPPTHEWSDSLALPQLLSGGAFHMVCRPLQGGQAPVSLCVGALAGPGPWAEDDAAEAGPFGEAAAARPAHAPARAPLAPFTLVLSPPLTLMNELPVPVELSLGADRLCALRPLGQASSHAGEDLRLPVLRLRAAGYRPQEQPLLSLAALGALGAAARERGEAAERVRAPGGGARYVRWVHEQRVPLVEQGQGAHRAGATLRQGLDVGSGARVLALSCALWVFNCAGQPLALRQAADDAGSPFGTDVDRALLPEDKMPEGWLPMLTLPPMASRANGAPGSVGSTAGGPASVVASARGGGAAADAGPHLLSPGPARPGQWGSVASSMPPLSRLASTAEFGGAGGVGPAAAGLGAVLSGGGGAASASSASETVAARRVLGRLHGADPGWGLVAGVDGQGAKDRTTMWPSLPAGPEPSAAHGRLRLQLRASPLAAAPGQTYWSVPVTLDAQGGAAIVSVPCPDGGATGRAGAGHRLDRAALVLAVTASPVGEGLPDAGAPEDGALALKAAVSSVPSRVPLALYLAPRYLLVNALSAAVQYRQQGTSLEWELPAGASCPVRFADGGAPLRLCVRLREAGWLWSGGFGLDSPGDTFIKVRHRDRGDTLLLRVGVAQTGSRAGSLAVSLARQPAGFSPYRIENCSLATVLVRQRRVRDQQDTLRPYCCLAYAWDEPARPHQLVLELAGGFRLGTWAPDRAPQDDLVRTPLGPLRVVVSAEGPCRVVTILDPARHPGGLRADAADRPAAAARWELTAALPTLGLSLVVRGAEVAYARVAGLRVRTSSGPAHLALELEAAGAQVDDPGCRAKAPGRYPTLLALPGPRQGLALGPGAHAGAGAGGTLNAAAAADARARDEGSLLARGALAAAPAPAVRLSLVVWHRRPAGVVCVEDARLEVAPLSLWLAQTHVEDLLAAGAALRRVFALAHGETGGDEGRARQGGGGGDVASSARGQVPAGCFVPSAPATSSPGSSAAPLETPEQPSTIISVAGGAWAPGPGLLGPGVDQLLGGAPLVLREDRKLFINYLELSPLGVSLSFMPAPLSHDRGFHFSTLKRLVSLAELEDVRLRLAGLSLRRPLIGEAALAATLQRHYVRALLPELVKLVGSAALFGDPIRLVHHLGLGVWAFLATPAVGLVESAKGGRPTHLVRGLLEGPRQAATHFAYALSNAATKATAAAQRALGALGVDRLGARDAAADAERGRGLVIAPGRRGTGTSPGAPTLVWTAGRARREPGRRGRDDAVLAALLRGLAGLVNEPAADLERDGLPGLVRGLARGSAGVVLLPLASLLDSLSFMAAAVRRAVAGPPALAWVRPPRPVPRARPLPAYREPEALGRWVLAELEAEAGADWCTLSLAEGPRPDDASDFVDCKPLAGGRRCLVLTRRGLIVAGIAGPTWSPVLQWSCDLADLESASAVPKTALLRLVAQAPRRAALAAEPARASVLPLSLCQVECDPAEDVAALAHSLLSAARHVQSQLILSQPWRLV